ncbi:unnamed protein product [Phyllotreta striolata]|uniref:Uncharacterized protein n=1 Tax=Phyllotreta striolata TaxID=444603 RepID=A0A9N9XHR9_PHYSR|nr:unnamed protein product [Phyllotreta striolata]
MGKFLAVFLAYVLMCNQCLIFRDPDANYAGPKLSSYVFLTAVCILLYDLRLYPKRLRKLDHLSQNIVEFFIAMFAMELVLQDFWYPLINGLVALLLHGAEKMEYLSDYEYLSDSLKDPSTVDRITYILSLFFLLSVLHAVRAIDFRALQEGPGCFFDDIAYRGRRFLLKKIRYLGFAKKRVKIKECKEKRSRRSTRDDDNEKTGTIDLEDFSKSGDTNVDDSVCSNSDCDSQKICDFDDLDLLIDIDD